MVIFLGIFVGNYRSNLLCKYIASQFCEILEFLFFSQDSYMHPMHPIKNIYITDRLE